MHDFFAYHSTIAALIVGLGSGLLGGLCGGLFNYRMHRQKMVEEANTRARDRLSARGEELYMLLADSMEVYEANIRRARAEFGHDREVFSTHLNQANAHLKRIDYLVHVFFPDLQAQRDKHALRTRSVRA